MMRWKAADNRNPVVLLRPIELRPLPAQHDRSRPQDEEVSQDPSHTWGSGLRPGAPFSLFSGVEVRGLHPTL